MTWGHAVRMPLLVLVLGWAGLAGAQPITVAGLQRLLQDAPKRELRFHETRESPWLAVSVESSGSLKSSATMGVTVASTPAIPGYHECRTAIAHRGARTTDPGPAQFDAARWDREAPPFRFRRGSLPP